MEKIYGVKAPIIQSPYWRPEYFCVCRIANKIHEGEGFYLQRDGTWLSNCTNGWFNSKEEIELLLEICKEPPTKFFCDDSECGCSAT